MTDEIDRIISQDDADRQSSLNKKTSYAVLSVNDALPHYVNHDLFDTFMENSLKCQDAIIEKFYRHILDKDEQFKERIKANNELNLSVINAILDLTKPKNIKEFSYLISLLNRINKFLLGSESGFGYSTTKFLKNNVNYELLRRFITQDQENEEENFAKYIYKYFFGFNLNKNEADFYLDNKNKDFININNTTALSTLINLINVYLTSGLIHARMHSRNEFLLTDATDNSIASNAKKFVRSIKYSNIYLGYENLLNKLTTAEKLNHLNNKKVLYVNSPNDNFFFTKPDSSFNVYKNVGDPNRNNIYTKLDENTQELIISSRSKDLINLDVAFEQISEPYQMLIKPLISSNNNAALASELNLDQRNRSLDRSITRSSYYLANKYLYDADNSRTTVFIENVKFNIGQAKTIFSKLYNKKQRYNLFESFYEKTAKSEDISERTLKSAVVLSNTLPNSLLVRNAEDVSVKDRLFSNNEIDYFESNNRISSPNKGFDKLNLLNEQDLDTAIELHQVQKDLLESKIDSLLDKNVITSCAFFEKILKKSTEGIRKSLEKIQSDNQNYIEYFPGHLLEEISLLLRFNSNKNDKGQSLSRNPVRTRRTMSKLFFAAAKNNSDIDRIADIYNLISSGNIEAISSGNVINDQSFLNKKIDSDRNFYLRSILKDQQLDNFDDIFRSFGSTGIFDFIDDFCNEKTHEVDFSKVSIDIDKSYIRPNGEKLYTARYYQSLGHVYSAYHTKRRQRFDENGNMSKILSKLFYIPFFGFIRGIIYRGKFKESDAPFNLYPLGNDNIFTQMKTRSASQGIVNSFINLLREIFESINTDEMNEEEVNTFITYLFKAYSQIVILQLSNLFEYSTLLHIPKMVSEGPIHYTAGLSNRNTANFANERRYARIRRNFDGEDGKDGRGQKWGGLKGPAQRYPTYSDLNDTDDLAYCNVKETFQQSQKNIENYLEVSNLGSYYSTNQKYRDKRLEFNEDFRAFKKKQSQPLTLGFFCKRINGSFNTKVNLIEGGLDSNIANGNPWFESLKQEAYSYGVLGPNDRSFWSFSTYPYNYPLLGRHNHLLSFYNGFIGFTIDKLLSQMKENYLFEKTELFERDMIYGPLSKIHNAFLAEDLSFTFLLDSVRYGFNHFKEYKNYLETLESDSTDLQEKRQLIEENLSKFYTSEEGFKLDEYLSTISKSQKLSLINKFRVDTIERNDYYYKLINKEKPTINHNTIIKNYKDVKADIIGGKYDKILVIGVGEDLLERSNGDIFINVYLKDFVYKKKKLNSPQKFKFSINDFGSAKILNADSYQNSISNIPYRNKYNLLSEKCRDYLAISTGNSLNDSDLFKSSNIESFENFEGAHYSRETSDILSNNLPEINSFYEELNNLKNNISSNEENFFFVQDNFSYSDETDLYLYEKSSKDKIKKDIVKRLALFDYMIFSNDVIGRKCLLREFPRIFYLPINTKDFYENPSDGSLRLKNLGDISVEVTLA